MLMSQKLEVVKIGKQLESYKDTFMDLISKGKFENDVSNTLTMKEGNSSYTFKYPVAPPCEDYYVIQHYKINTIQNIPSDERWKHAEASIKIHTSSRDTKDSNISNKINDVVREILDRPYIRSNPDLIQGPKCAFKSL
ncbi:uncharacterized protein LOC107883281 [Acyrthosiphon pisum]|uniref:Uncharacterized protein n=1 Tax=Acyrthosiphon pisum TaxID=7029 RepID=A0A8R2D3Y0_ACYPI|nr:uncharacterized protein LOC107883281 [Acyrthosiphon pisum]|eukprot:XP_016658437.1 PREDICTED: uncharacterized protein LOC107883281 [Acyrthosiphon pisum]